MINRFTLIVFSVLLMMLMALVATASASDPPDTPNPQDPVSAFHVDSCADACSPVASYQTLFDVGKVETPCCIDADKQTMQLESEQLTITIINSDWKTENTNGNGVTTNPGFLV